MLRTISMELKDMKFLRNFRFGLTMIIIIILYKKLRAIFAICYKIFEWF